MCGLIISSSPMELLLLQYYEQIRAKALKQGVKDNKVHIGLWANLNNYLKTRRKKNGKVTTYYISLQKLAY